MQLTYNKFLLTCLLVFAGLYLHAQSLGDPVLFEDFGRASSVYQSAGNPLPAGVTTLAPSGTRCPPDGSYSLITSSDNCFDNTWITVNKDYGSDDSYGFMMMINASTQASVFYTQQIPATILCSGSSYEFSVYITNVLRPLNNNTFIRPNIRFIVTKTDGTVIDDSYTTGEIEESNSVNWKKYFIRFTAPADGQGIVIKLLNENPGSLGNDFAMDNISVNPYGEVIKAGFGNAGNNVEKNLCVGQGPTGFHLEADAGNYTSPVYQWQINTDGKGWTNINGATSATLDINVPDVKGRYQYRVGVLGGAATSPNCRIFSDPLRVSRFELPVFNLPATTSVCQGEPLMFNADRGTSYQWFGPNNFTSTEQNPLVSSAATADLTGVYTLIVSKDGCSVTTSTSVNVAPPLILTLNNRNPVVCEGETYMIEAGGGTTYKWTPSIGLSNANIANPVITATESIDYQVTVSNGGCEKIGTVSITVIKKPVINAGPDRNMQETEPIKLDATITGNYESFYWAPTDYMQDPTSLTPTVNPPDDITYTLHVVQANSCGETSDGMNVQVYKKVNIPTAFTPNADGINDLWRIDKLVSYPESELIIYTRNGQQVFRTVGGAKQWNGQLNGKNLPPGVYYYIIDLKNNLPKKAGWVTLVR
jgi:gliding motility-associated-like protein